MTIFPGETATCEFIVPFQADGIQSGKLSFSQDNKRVLVVDITSNEIFTEDDQTHIAVALSQDESLKLKNNIMCYLQINLLLTDNNRAVSELVPLHVGPQTYPYPIYNDTPTAT